MLIYTSRFVIHLHHLTGSIHWDLMLLSGDVLSTYRIDKPLGDIAAGQEAVAEKIEDHSVRFLDYQGPVNKGMATVKIVYEGTYTIKEQSEDKFKLRLVCQEVDAELLFTKTREDLWQVKIVSI